MTKQRLLTFKHIFVAIVCSAESEKCIKNVQFKDANIIVQCLLLLYSTNTTVIILYYVKDEIISLKCSIGNYDSGTIYII